MTPTDPSDAVIVRRTLAGDVEAFALLVDRYHAGCLKVATGILGDSDDAEDAVQEAFVRAYRALASYHDRERFGAWLMRITVNQCRTHATRRRKWRADGDADLVGTLPDPAENPSEAAARREELARALALLRPGEELSYDEMATITGVGVSALKMRVQRACVRLRALLTESLHA
jgi:RNA polymerase sigma-70 factor (ECF subfamily)